MLTPCLPGLEDVQAPPGLEGWDYALWRLARKPARRIVLLALRVLAGTRAECCPTNEAIRAAVAGLGHAPPDDRGLTLLLRKLESEDRLIVRSGDRRAKSRRRIGFAFLGQSSFKGAHDRHPRAHTIDTQGRTRSTPKGAHPVRPPDPQVVGPVAAAPEPVAPLNSIPMQEEETLRACAPVQVRTPAPTAAAEPEPAGLDAYWAKVRAHAEARARAKAAEPPPAPTTAELIGRLADPCGPEAVEAAARQIASNLGDEKSVACYRGMCEAVRAGELAAGTLADAYKAAWSAKEAGLPRPGGVLVNLVKDRPPPGGAQKAAPGSTRLSTPGAAQHRLSSALSNSTGGLTS